MDSGQCNDKSYRTALVTYENPALSEVDLEPSSQRGTTAKRLQKINLRMSDNRLNSGSVVTSQDNAQVNTMKNWQIVPIKKITNGIVVDYATNRINFAGKPANCPVVGSIVNRLHFEKVLIRPS